MSVTKDFIQAQAELFWEAMQLTSRQKQLALLAQRCVDRPTLRIAVEQLLQNHERKPGLLDHDWRRLASSADVPPPEKLETRQAAYFLQERLGAGAMGTVYRATQAGTFRDQVAVKVSRSPIVAPLAAANLVAERQTLARLEHPYVVRFLDAGSTDDERPFLVMERVTGDNLRKTLENCHWGICHRLSFLERVCIAVEHLHARGLIHCDLKPGNIMVARHWGEPIPKLIDFGIARHMHVVSTETTRLGDDEFVGTPAYMPPERLLGCQPYYEPSTDIYSLGAVAYEMIAGMPPIALEPDFSLDARKLRRRLNFIDPIRLIDRFRLSRIERRGISEPLGHQQARRLQRGWIELDEAVMRCLEKAPRDRFRSVAEFRLRLRRCREWFFAALTGAEPRVGEVDLQTETD